jgi:hypothetical protein
LPDAMAQRPVTTPSPIRHDGALPEHDAITR